jgi:AraC-like DNA-binding protein
VGDIKLKTASPTRFRFCTDDLPPNDRLAIWREVVGRHYMRLEIEPQDPSGIWASIDAQKLPAGGISSAQFSPACFRRTRELLQDGNGDFAFNWIGQGGYRILGEDAEANLAEGDGALLFHGAPGTFVAERRTQLTSVRLDGALVRSKMPDIDERLFHRPLADDTSFNLLKAYVGVLVAVGVPADPVLAHAINDHIVDLISASLRPTDDDYERALESAIPVARLAAAKADIRANLADPALSARQVALRLRLSERSIYLLFERSGLSFAGFVTDERLKRAAAILRDPARKQLRIGDIAFAAGFGDLTTFNRSFRRRYGQTPSSLRRQGSD